MRKSLLSRTSFVPVLAVFTTVLVLLSASAASAAFPAVNGKIAYAHQVGMSSSAIYSANPNGSAPRDLSASPSTRTADFQPAWSANGKQIAFVRVDLQHCSGQIWTMNADGTAQANRSNDGATFSEINPAYGPDGSLVFVRTVPGRFNICTQSAVNEGNLWVRRPGGAVRQLTRDGLDNTPALSPDGSKVAFTRNAKGAPPSGPPHVLVMNANGTGAARDLGPGLKPNWSPDGSKIVFAAPGPPMGPSGGAVTVMSANGSGRKTLSTAGTAPVFSPDGQQIAFLMFTGPMSSAVAVMSASGANPHTITNPGSGNSDVKPDWQPLPGMLRLTVSPHKATAGRRACFHFRVSSSGRPLAGVRIVFAHRAGLSSRLGTARLCVRLGPGVHLARATKLGYRGATARVRARRRVRH